VLLSEPGDARYGSATVLKDVEVVKASQVIEFGGLADIGFGVGPIELKASASSGLEVGYEVVAKHQFLGDLWSLGLGEVEGGQFVLPSRGLFFPLIVTVKASQGGSELYEAAQSVEQSLEVVQGEDVLSFEPIGNRLVEGGDIELEASAASGLNPTFSLVDGPALVSLGKLMMTGSEGVVTVRASTRGNKYYEATELEQSFGVKNKGWIALETMSGGTVELDPAQELYDPGTVVKLTPKPGEGYEFAGWSGELDGTTSPRNVTVNAPMSVGAKFKDVAAPAVSLSGPAAGTTSEGTFSLSGSVSDNAGVGGASWSLNGKDQGVLTIDSGGAFSVSGLKLDYGANLIKVSAGDEAGNVGTGSVELKWSPERTLKIGTVLERQEGQVVEIPIELESQGGVSSMTFVLKYDPVYLAEP
ncbi:MAG: Ig-like domain-containing protein, partial [Myxococcota bacterium]|nr:Ig-like domain-containing protein [Myxococcota bacterium]